MASSPSIALPGTAGLFDVPKKITVIRLRWLVVIICSYLLLSSEGTWLSPTSVHGFIFIYVLSNMVLYWVEDSLFDSSYFYSPLVVFDTLFVTASLVLSGQVETDFYLAYFLVVILCTIWQDFRGLLVVAVLATLLYGYFLFKTTQAHDPSIYLRIPFLFVISLFYGYFAQVVRAEKVLKEQAEQEAKDMAMIQTLSQLLPSSLDYRQVLETVSERLDDVIHAARIYIFIEQDPQGSSRALIFGRGGGENFATDEVNLREYPAVQECIRTQNPVIMSNVSPKLLSAKSPTTESQVFPFPMLMAVPMAFRGEGHGVILLCFLEADRVLSSREIQFCQIVGFATAIALSNAKKYEELQAEARRRQIIAEQLADANRLKSEYLASTSHELRTPIATIMGYGHLLSDGACGPLTQEQKKAMGRLMENARGLLGIVDALLDYSKIERGETGLFVKRGDVRPLLDQLQQELAPLESKKPFKVQYEVGDDIPLIETDWGKLKNVLMSILNNAVKFTDRGEVRLSVVKAANGNVSFVVSDTGIGIPKDLVPLIFDKFRQLDGSPARSYEGTGLGLTISKNLVELIGGKIEVESEVGKGSTFKVTIPATNN
ncbi:MAG: GAF domain-containing protein [Deltaproteobacteria bacterium]|nr:GAF domain-containing protein [Deltaproteobacteria bacterium]